MRKFLTTLLILTVTANLLPAAGYSAGVTTNSNSVQTLQPELKQTAKKKRNKGYKKPKKKKFLGIFKRKSSCDCPKH